MKRINKGLILITIIILCAQNAFSIPKRPPNDSYINDLAGVISRKSRDYIFSNSKVLDDKTSAQLVVVTVESLEGRDIDEYSLDIIRNWGIGDKSKNNGALLLLSISDRKVKIKVGDGLEGAVNDGKAGRILDNYGIPHFEANDWDSGIIGCYSALISEIYKEYNLEVPQEVYNYHSTNENEKKSDLYIEIGTMILVIALFILASKRGGGPPFIGGGPFIGGFFTGLGGGVGGFGGGNFGSGHSSGRFGGGSAGGGGASRGF